VFCRLRKYWIHSLFYFLARDVWTRDIEDGDEYYCLIERFIDGESSKTPTYERHLQQAIEESLEATRQYNQPQISEVGGQQSSAHEINEEEVKMFLKFGVCDNLGQKFSLGFNHRFNSCLIAKL